MFSRSDTPAMILFIDSSCTVTSWIMDTFTPCLKNKEASEPRGPVRLGGCLLLRNKGRNELQLPKPFIIYLPVNIITQ